MFEGMDTSYNPGGFMATQDTGERKSVVRGRGTPWIPVLTSDVHDLLPGQDTIRRGTLESSEVTLVGVIRSAERKLNMMSIDYHVDDNAGPPLLVNQLLEEEGTSPVVPLTEGTYIRVVGKVRTWGNQRGITAFAVLPVKDLNELTMHILEVAHCKLFYSKDVLRRHEERAQNKTAPSTAGGATFTAATGTAPSYPSGANITPSTYPGVVSSGLTGINAEIHKYLSTATSESGYNVNDVQRRFPQLNAAKIRDHLELLSSEGHVYTTVDDDHYRTTDS